MLALPGPEGWTPAPTVFKYNPPISFDSVFPLEIYERIIDFCAHPANFPNALRDCRLTLRAWALTCKALLNRVRFHLWREIKVRDTKEVNALTQTLKRNSHLSPFIQSIDVWMDAPASMFITLANAKIKRLKYMHLSGERPLRHKLFFQTMFQFKSVTILWIAFRIQAHQFMRLLCCFPNLLFLKLEGHQDCYAPIPEATKYAPKCRLECAQIRFLPGDTHVKAWRYILRCLVDTNRCLTGLKVLELTFSDAWDGAHVDVANISLALASAGETLTDLTIHYSHEWDSKELEDTNLFNSLSLENNPALRRLVIEFDRRGQKDLSGLLHMLETAHCGTLEYLAIIFSDMSQKSEGLNVEEQWWKDVDEVLSKERFKNLKALDIHPSYTNFADEMKKAKKKGVLAVTPRRLYPVRNWMRAREFWL